VSSAPASGRDPGLADPALGEQRRHGYDRV